MGSWCDSSGNTTEERRRDRSARLAGFCCRVGESKELKTHRKICSCFFCVPGAVLLEMDGQVNWCFAARQIRMLANSRFVVGCNGSRNGCCVDSVPRESTTDWRFRLSIRVSGCWAREGRARWKAKNEEGRWSSRLVTSWWWCFGTGMRRKGERNWGEGGKEEISGSSGRSKNNSNSRAL